MPPTLSMSSERPGVGVVALGVADVVVAGARPRAVEGGEAARALVPVAGGAVGPRTQSDRPPRRPARARRPRRTSFDVVAGHGLAGGAVAHVAVAVREEDVEHLGRADAVEDVGADALAPALADVPRQRLARRGATRAARATSAVRRRSGSASSEANSVGTPQKIVGCCAHRRAATAAASGARP